MLAQSFKTAEELNITEKQRDALMKTLVLLETGKLVHTDIGRFEYFIGNEFTGHFNMAVWNRVEECGTVCCIGGTAELIGNVNLTNIDPNINENLYELFYPQDFGGLYGHISVDQAAMALRSYLTTGKAGWNDILNFDELIKNELAH